MVKNTLSDETTSARTPKGNGSNTLSPGITCRFTRLQPKIRIACASRNPIWPTSLCIAALTRSVGVRRSRASCSSWAIASMLYCVGFAAARRGNGFSMGQLLETVLEDIGSSRDLQTSFLKPHMRMVHGFQKIILLEDDSAASYREPGRS